ncbi:primosomal protein DnaI [Thioclava sp. SK-1]|uniref:DUF1127 domain-containing protein n=1 Tax=Thioclava sp. SK-1 TaxID=1889770 RepID=UPI00082457D8|nr:DUF1127 domain-containing protein [Thioclava sp. SK-1]OCX64650.1 primosomal protein DnaI [Thioclava sp. SK-1]
MSVQTTNRIELRSGAATGLFAQAFQAILAWNDARMTRRALDKLSDRELDDIGLTRFDIAQVR